MFCMILEFVQTRKVSSNVLPHQKTEIIRVMTMIIFVAKTTI